MKFFQKALLYVLGISFGTMEVGFTLAYFSPAYLSITTEFSFSSIDESLFNSLAPIAAIIGGIVVQFITGRLSRKYILFGGNILSIIGWILLLITKKSYKPLLFIARVVSGVGIGAVSTISPIYIAELSPTETRGAYGVMSQLFVSCGAMLSYLIGIWCNWLVIAGISLIPGVICFIWLFFIPHSPFDIENELNDDSTAPTEEKVSLRQKKYFLRLLISILLVVFQQFSGINALLTNLNPIFERSKINIKSSIAAFIVGAAQVLSNAFSTPIVERLGRRLIWTISSGGQALFLLLSWANEKWQLSSVLPIVCLFFDVLIFGIGLGPLPWFVAPELFPDSIRSTAVSITQASNWILCSVMIFAFPAMVKSMTIAWVYFFYGIVMVLSLLYGLFLLPETKGSKMGEISECKEIATASL